MDFEFQRMTERTFRVHDCRGLFDKIEFMGAPLKKDEYELTSLNKIKEDITYFLNERFFESINSYGDRYIKGRYILRLGFIDSDYNEKKNFF